LGALGHRVKVFGGGRKTEKKAKMGFIFFPSANMKLS